MGQFENGVEDARASLAHGGTTTSVPQTYPSVGNADWTRGWDSIIDGPEGDAWRRKVRVERGEAIAASVENEERLRLVGLANAVLDAPLVPGCTSGHELVVDVRKHYDDARALARAVLDAKVLR